MRSSQIQEELDYPNEFERLTGVPVVLTSSFNENEPVVCKPEEAIEWFLRTNTDVWAIGNYLVEKVGCE